MPVNSDQIRKNSDSLVDGGSESAYVTIANDAIIPARMGWKPHVETIAANAFTFLANVSTYTLVTNASLDSHVEKHATLWRNGIQYGEGNKVAAPPASAGQWSVEAGKLSIYGDVTTPVVDEYELKYPTETAGSGSTEGDFTRSHLLTREGTASTFELTIGGGAPSGTSNRMVLEDDTSKMYEILVSARRTDAGDESASYKFLVQLDRQTGAISTALVGTPVKYIVSEDDVACDCAVSANTTDGAVKIEFTAPAGKTYKANAYARVVTAAN